MSSSGVSDGLIVTGVEQGSPAYQAGIRGLTRPAFGPIMLGDVIVAIKDKKIHNEADFLLALDGYQVGETIEMLVVRYIGASNQPNAITAFNLADQFKLARELKVKLKLKAL